MTTDVNPNQYVSFVVGDRANPVQRELKRDGAAIDLTSYTVAFSMYRESNDSAKVSDAPATIVDAANGIVRYQFAAADVDEAGEYRGYFIITTGGLSEHIPHDGAKLHITIRKP